MGDLAFRVDEAVGTETTGHKRFEFIEPKFSAFQMQKREIRNEFGIELPPWNTLDRFGPILDLKLLCSEITAFIQFSDTSWLEFRFWPGFLTDLASVPRFMRGIVENGDVRMLIAVLIHDYLYSTHALPFEYANELMYQVSVHNGYPRARAWLSLVAVSSPVGRIKWRKNHERRDDWTRHFAEMRMSRPVTIDGKQYDSLLRLAA